MKYLKFFNDELARYYKEMYQCEFDKLDKESYQFVTINDAYYPCPKSGYHFKKKNRSLEELIIKILNKHDLGKNAYKLTGLIPENLINDMIKNGDFFMEDKATIFGLCHGKLAHMIQLIILCYAIDNHDITIKYKDNEGKKLLTVRDILEAFILKIENAEQSLFIKVCDSRDLNKISFADPTRLISVIMHNGHQFQIDVLSDYLIDSFCKGLKTLLHFCNEHNSIRNINYQELVSKLNNMTVTVATPNFTYVKSIFKESKKHTCKNIELKKDENIINYAITTKKYEPSETFEPRKFC